MQTPGLQKRQLASIVVHLSHTFVEFKKYPSKQAWQRVELLHERHGAGHPVQTPTVER